MKEITAQGVIDLYPCWSDGNVYRVFESIEKESITAMDVAMLEFDIAVDHRMWLMRQMWYDEYETYPSLQPIYCWKLFVYMYGVYEKVITATGGDHLPVFDELKDIGPRRLSREEGMKFWPAILEIRNGAEDELKSLDLHAFSYKWYVKAMLRNLANAVSTVVSVWENPLYNVSSLADALADLRCTQTGLGIIDLKLDASKLDLHSRFRIVEDVYDSVIPQQLIMIAEMITEGES